MLAQFGIMVYLKLKKNKLQTTQNKMIRFVLNLDAKTSIRKEHFNHLSWLPVEKRVHHSF